MKNLFVLSLLFLTSATQAFERVEAIRLSDDQRIELDREFSLTTAPLIERFGSGDIVGNGGGLVEQNFSMAYFSVQTAIDNCLVSRLCYNSLEQKNVLREINNLYIEKLDQKNALVFISNKQTDNFFYDEHDQTERLAKTGFSKAHPIFINLDQAKEIRNNIPAMIAILIHELGHQIGVANHSYLDQLAAKVRKDFESNWVESTFDIKGKKLTMKLFSTKNNFINSKLSYSFEGKVRSLNGKVFEQLKCNPGESLYGFYISNGHWQRPTSNRNFYKVQKKYWIDMYCKDIQGSIWPMEKDLTVEFIFGQVQGVGQNLEKVNVSIK